MNRPAAVRTGRAVAGVALALASASVLAGCTSPRNALGTPDGRCFKVLPEAKVAVHGVGRFSGVRYVTIADFSRLLARLHPAIATLPIAHLRATTAACVVAYTDTGEFRAATVAEGAPTGGEGHLALVVLRASDAQVLATIVLKHAPIRFARLDSLER